MADQPFDELERTQSETVQALRLLTGQLRRYRDAGQNFAVTDFDRLHQPSGNEQSGGQAAAARLEGIVPSVSASRPEELRLLGDVGIQNALGQTTRAVEFLTHSVTRNTDVLNETSKSIVDGIRGVFSSFVGLRPQGGGGLSSFGSGLGLASLGLKIAGLFRGDKEEATPLTPFDLPPGINLEVANPSNVLAGFPRVVRGQDERVRAIQPQAAPTQVVVNVSAMDSQSFLDRSTDIAQAVRDAMLHMHPINDMVSEV